MRGRQWQSASKCLLPWEPYGGHDKSAVIWWQPPPKKKTCYMAFLTQTPFLWNLSNIYHFSCNKLPYFFFYSKIQWLVVQKFNYWMITLFAFINTEPFFSLFLFGWESNELSLCDSRSYPSPSFSLSILDKIGGLTSFFLTLSESQTPF